VKSASSASLVAAALLLPSTALAGGGPMNVLVVYSGDDVEATGVAQHYLEARDIPVQHFCPLVGFTPETTNIDADRFTNDVVPQIDACLALVPEPDEIDYLVLVRGLPYVVDVAGYPVSFEAALQVGHATLPSGEEIAGGPQPGANASIANPAFKGGFFNTADSTVTNQYSGWYGSASAVIRNEEQQPSFRRKNVEDVGGYGFAGQVFIVQSLDGFDYQDARDLVDRSVASDGTMPTQEIMCMRGEDDARAARDPECELTTRMLASAGFNGVWLDAFDGALAGRDLMGYMTGSSDSVKNAIAGNTFAPGALTDNLTSYGAVPNNFFCNDDGSVCPASESQTSCARFVRAGATGAHGTAVEPFNNVFPNAGAFLHYTFGYSMGESYFFNQRFLYWENVHLGDPLATPYAVRPLVTIDADTERVIVHAEHANGVARVALFKDGVRIGEAEGADLEVESPGNSGDTFTFLAVATAENAAVTRSGWPQEAQLPQPDVQGWVAENITLASPPQNEGGAGAGSGGNNTGGDSALPDGFEDDPDDGCGCTVGQRRVTSWGAVAGLIMVLAARRKKSGIRELCSRSCR
jgi:uncharacterized protein (TIGR03790 family)